MSDETLMTWLEVLAAGGGYHEELPEMSGVSREVALELTDDLLNRGWVTALPNRGDDRLLAVRKIRVTQDGQAALADAMRRREPAGVSAVAAPVEEKRRLRFDFTKALYDATDGSRAEIVEMFDLGESLGWDRGRISNVVEYLEGEGLVKYMTLGGGISITHRGVVELEEALTEPAQPTEHFPPVSIISVGTMVGSQISQASPGSSQVIEVMQRPQLDEAATLLRELREVVLPAVDFAEEDRSEFEAELGTVEQQLGSSRPKSAFVRASFARMAEMLRTASTTAGSAVQLAEYTQRLHDLLPGV